MKLVDPTAMTETERLDELCELLARGLQRLLAHERKVVLAQERANNSRDHLDDLGQVEAPCGRSRAPSPKSPEPRP